MVIVPSCLWLCFRGFIATNEASRSSQLSTPNSKLRACATESSRLVLGKMTKLSFVFLPTAPLTSSRTRSQMLGRAFERLVLLPGKRWNKRRMAMGGDAATHRDASGARCHARMALGKRVASFTAKYATSSCSRSPTGPTPDVHVAGRQNVPTFQLRTRLLKGWVRNVHEHHGRILASRVGRSGFWYRDSPASGRQARPE